MRTLRLSLVGMVVMALLAGLGGAVVAQDEEAAQAVWVKLTQQENCEGGYPGKYSEGPGLAKRVRDYPWGCDVTYSDARLNGRTELSVNEDCYEDGMCVNWGTTSIVGTDGTWSGSFRGINDAPGYMSLSIVATGSGAYEGFTSTLFSLGMWEEFSTEYGVIYEGDPPPMPDPMEQPVE